MARLMRWVLLALLLAPLPAAAEGFTLTAIAGWWQAWGAYVMAAYAVYGYVDGREKARRQRNTARDRFNDGLTDRTVQLLSASAPWQVVYGEPVVGGRIVAELTSGDRDQVKHLVVVWADHECDAITDVLVNGLSLGALTPQGDASTGKWVKTSTYTPTESHTMPGNGVLVLPFFASGVISLSWLDVNSVQSIGEGLTQGNGEVIGPDAWTTSGNTLTLNPDRVAGWAGRTVQVTYDTTTYTPLIRVVHHLGAPGQVADAGLLAECPGQWSATDLLADKCYSVVRLSLDEPELQNGPPQLTVKLRGKKVHDPRTNTTVWSDNPALCTADYLTAEYGKGQLPQQVQWPSVAAAANVCDEVLTTHPGERRYTCHGAISTDSDTDQNLNALCQAMAGFATFHGTWHLQAGAWAAPVMALTDADNLGAVEVAAGPAGMDTFNGLRGQFYDPERYDQLTDYVPYSNAGFVAADGAEMWGRLDLPFTYAAWRAHNLARIAVERARGQTLQYPAKLRAMQLKTGQRVALSCSALGLEAATYRVVKHSFKIGGPVLLTLAQDDPSVYDEADAPAPLAAPAHNVPDPWRVGLVQGLAAVSANAVVIRDADGVVISRVRVSWTASTDHLVNTGGALQLQYRLDSAAQWQQVPEVSSATAVDLPGLVANRVYVLRARWRNALGAVGDWRSAVVLTTAAVGTGGSGAGGVQTAHVFIYRRSSSGTPALPTGAVTYSFTTGAVAGLTNGWSSVPVSGGGLLYVSAATASAAAGASTATVAPSAFSAAVPMALDGVDGADGEAGASGNLVQNSDFALAATDGRPVGFALYSNQGLPVLYVRNPGYGGGLSAGMVAQASGAADGSSTWGLYSNNTWVEQGVAGGVTGGWQPNTSYVVSWWAKRVGAPWESMRMTWNVAPAQTEWIEQPTMSGDWVRFAVRVVMGPTPEANGQFHLTVCDSAGNLAAIPQGAELYLSRLQVTQGGVLTPWLPYAGPGRDGLNTATVMLFTRTETAEPPALPTAPMGYTFGTAVVTDLHGGWAQTLPATGGGYRWMTLATALGTAGTDTVATTEWSPARLLAQDGSTGPQGDQGIEGPRGPDGLRAWFHVAYASSADGTVGFNQSVGDYIGTYSDTTQADSTNPAAYTWRLFRGAQGTDGTNGIAGTNGADGQTSYLHIKYSNDGGTTFTGNGGEDDGAFVGTLVDFNLADSTSPGAYTWKRWVPPTYRQEADPAASTTVPEGSTWTVPSTGRSYVRQGGAWVAVVGTGSVNTGELAAGAATRITSLSAAGEFQYIVGPPAPGDAPPTISVVPQVSCLAMVTVIFDAQPIVAHPSWSTDYVFYVVMAQQTSQDGTSQAQPFSGSRARYALQAEFPVLAGIEASFSLAFDSPTGFNGVSVWNITYRVEEIKR